MTHAEIHASLKLHDIELLAKKSRIDAEFQKKHEELMSWDRREISGLHIKCGEIGHIMGSKDEGTKTRDDPLGQKPTCVICGFKS